MFAKSAIMAMLDLSGWICGLPNFTSVRRRFRKTSNVA